LLICSIGLAGVEALNRAVDNLHQLIDGSHDDIIVIAVFPVLENNFITIEKIVG